MARCDQLGIVRCWGRTLRPNGGTSDDGMIMGQGLGIVIFHKMNDIRRLDRRTFNTESRGTATINTGWFHTFK